MRKEGELAAQRQARLQELREYVQRRMKELEVILLGATQLIDYILAAASLANYVTTSKTCCVGDANLGEVS